MPGSGVFASERESTDLVSGWLAGSVWVCGFVGVGVGVGEGEGQGQGQGQGEGRQTLSL